MASAYDVRRRLVETSHKRLIYQLADEPGIPNAVAVEALMLASGDVDAVLAAIDFISFPRTTVENGPKCARLLYHLRKTTGAQL